MGLPETLEAKFSRPDALLKSYINLEAMQGKSGKVTIPGPNALPEEREAYNKAIGVPDKPEGYGLKAPEKIGDKAVPKELWDAAGAKAFSELAHKLGLTPAQAQAIVEYDVSRNLTAVDGVKAAHDKQLADARATLKGEWGVAHDDRMKLAEAGAKASGFVAAENPELANSPAFIKAMARVGEMIGEKPAAGARTGGMTPADAKTQINAIRGDKNHPYNNRSVPGHAEAVTQVQNLYRQIHGDVPVSMR